MNHIYNSPVSGDIDIVERIQNQVRSIYQFQNVSFRLNFAIGMILKKLKLNLMNIPNNSRSLAIIAGVTST